MHESEPHSSDPFEDDGEPAEWVDYQPWQAFPPDPGLRTGVRSCLVVSLVGIALCSAAVAAIIWNSDGFVLLAIVGGLLGGGVFALFALYYAKLNRELENYGVVVDDVGVWPMHRDREEALVPWESVMDARWRRLRRRTDLLGADGEVLLSVHRNLAGHESLNRFIKTKLSEASYDTFPHMLTRERFWRLRTLLFAHMFIGVVVVNVAIRFPAVGTALAIIVGLLYTAHLLLTPSHLMFFRRRIEIHYLIHRVKVYPEEIEGIEIRDHEIMDEYIPELVIHRWGRRPVSVYGLPVTRPELQGRLEAWAAAQGWMSDDASYPSPDFTEPPQS